MATIWRARNPARTECGFSLLEVLIAIVILAIGLLGVARLQANSIGFNHGAYLRSQATLQISDMADRMRSNMPGVAAGNYDALAGTPADPGGCLSTGCTPAQMAQYDAFDWNTSNANQLPDGAGTVTGSGAGSLFTITVTWTEMSEDTPITGSVQSTVRL